MVVPTASSADAKNGNWANDLDVPYKHCGFFDFQRRATKFHRFKKKGAELGRTRLLLVQRSGWTCSAVV